MSTTTTDTTFSIEPHDLYRMTVDQYEQMADLGVLDDPRIELIDGLLVRKMTKKPPHVLATERVRRGLDPLLPIGWYLREEKPLRIPDFDEPEPDIAVVRGVPEDYANRHPGPDDVGLIIEAAERSLARDRGAKLTAYGRGRVPEYWIINLVERTVERYSQPTADGGYGSRQILRPGESVPVVLEGQELGSIPVSLLLP
jgi:Uma2 family endonuclease